MSSTRPIGPRAGAVAAVLLLLLAPTAAPRARADTQLIINGGFEAGFAGWTRADELGSEGTFAQQSGALSPVTGLPVPAPPGGTSAAMTDAEGPGSHVLYQDFLVPADLTSGVLSFSLFIGNRADGFFVPSTLAFSTPTLNQQARVDLLLAGTDPFSVAAGDVLLNVFQTQEGDPLVSGYTTITTDISPLIQAQAGQMLRLRFAEVDNVNLFQFGVDNVSLAAIPEPSTLAMVGVGGLAVALATARHRARRRRKG